VGGWAVGCSGSGVKKMGKPAQWIDPDMLLPACHVPTSALSCVSVCSGAEEKAAFEAIDALCPGEGSSDEDTSGGFLASAMARCRQPALRTEPHTICESSESCVRQACHTVCATCLAVWQWVHAGKACLQSRWPQHLSPAHSCNPLRSPWQTAIYLNSCPATFLPCR